MKLISKTYFQDVHYSIDFNSYHKIGYNRWLVKVLDIYTVENYVVVNSHIVENSLLAWT